MLRPAFRLLSLALAAAFLAAPLVVGEHTPRLPMEVHGLPPASDEVIHNTCTGNHRKTFSCERNAWQPATRLNLRVSTCQDRGATWCSSFTGTLAITISDPTTLPDKVEVDFVEGALSPVRARSGDNLVAVGQQTLSVEVQRLSIRTIGGQIEDIEVPLTPNGGHDPLHAHYGFWWVWLVAPN